MPVPMSRSEAGSGAPGFEIPEFPPIWRHCRDSPIFSLTGTAGCKFGRAVHGYFGETLGPGGRVDPANEAGCKEALKLAAPECGLTRRAAYERSIASKEEPS